MGRPCWQCLAGLLTLQLAGVGIFFGGFLLTRLELTELAKCSPLRGGDSNKSQAETNGSCGLAVFDKLVVLVIDGLRYDLVDPPRNGAISRRQGNLRSLSSIQSVISEDVRTLSTYNYPPPPGLVFDIRCQDTAGTKCPHPIGHHSWPVI